MACNWGPANHTYFQLANVFLAFSYLVPNSLKGLIALRFVLGTAGFFFMLWAAVILCSPDTLGWNLAFMVINFGHVGYLLWTTRPSSFSDEHEICYQNVFELLGVARWQYKAMAQLGVVRELKKDALYAKEDETDVPDISLVLRGSCCVSRAGTLIARVKPYEFLDSPEWLVSTGSGAAFPFTYEVTIISEGAVIISWNRNALVRVLRGQPFLKNIFDSLVGQDVAKKVFKQNKTIGSQRLPRPRSRSGLLNSTEVVETPKNTNHVSIPSVVVNEGFGDDFEDISKGLYVERGDLENGGKFHSFHSSI